MFITGMFQSNLVLVLLAFALCISDGKVVSSPDSGSGDGDQYPNREETGVLVQPPSKMAPSRMEGATDRLQKVDQNDLLMRVLSPKSINTKNAKTHGSPLIYTRPKRSYHPYNPNYQLQWPQFEGLNTWKTSFYPIQRPYFVPIYGYADRIPLYYPPCTYYHNAGTPPHNPDKPPYVGPTYLPPITTIAPPAENGTTKMPIDDRFGNNDDDDRPIWDNNGAYYPNRATTPRSFVAPTRRPASRTTTPPPLVHRDSDATTSTTTERSANDIAPVPENIPRPQGPSKCVWAIVSCCSTSSRDISYECFDQLGCGGPFWDVNPCDTEYAKAAIQTALDYYNTRS